MCLGSRQRFGVAVHPYAALRAGRADVSPASAGGAPWIAPPSASHLSLAEIGRVVGRTGRPDRSVHPGLPLSSTVPPVCRMARPRAHGNGFIGRLFTPNMSFLRWALARSPPG
jgi:hypothetical protein